jgi:4'-phosphopantetheinyl transferase
MTAWPLAPNEAVCWTFAPPVFRNDELAQTLSHAEKAHAAEFKLDRDRERYVICRGLLKRLLARYGAGEADALVFEYTANGKPLLASNPAELQFNVAHSGEMAAIGVTRHRSIGVDVEHVRHIENLSELVEMNFAPEEQAAWRSIPEPIQARAFFAGWTRKEAFLKATGEGLSRPLTSFALTINPDALPQVIRVDGDRRAGAAWTVVDLRLGNAVAGAVVVAGADITVRSRELLPEMLGLSRRGPVTTTSSVQ